MTEYSVLPDAALAARYAPRLMLDAREPYRPHAFGYSFFRGPGSRDICGANALGITSIFMAWSTLRTHVPADQSEVADYRIDAPAQLPGLLDRLEALLQHRVSSPSTQKACQP